MEAWQAHAERAAARFDALWQKYLDATRPPEPKAVVAQTYRSDEQAVRVVEDGFVKKLAADLKAKGIPDAVAQMEATRIRRETTRVGALELVTDSSSTRPCGGATMRRTWQPPRPPPWRPPPTPPASP